MKQCSKCEETKPLAEFNQKGQGRYQPYCRQCDNAHSRAQYQRNRAKMIRQIKAAEARRRERLRDWVCLYLEANSCVDCGEADIVVLEFDHLRDKEANVSKLLGDCASQKRLEQEIAKCEVVCANCHRRRTAERSQNYKYSWVAKLVAAPDC